MIIVAIAVVGRNLELGRKLEVPAELSVPGDLRRFRLLTSGHPVIMGRKTFLSLGDRPLLNRTNVVLSRRPDSVRDVVFCRTPEEALSLAVNIDRLVFIIGGAEIYRTFFAATDELWLTEVEADVLEADAFFPEYPATLWEAYEQISGRGWRFIKYRRRAPLI